MQNTGKINFKNMAGHEKPDSKNLTDHEKSLHEKFTEYGQNAKKWLHKCKLLLPEIAKRGIWKKKGFGSIYEYAAKIAGMSHYMVDDTLRILGKIKDKPQLMEVAEKKGLSSVRPVAAIATQESASFWAEKAEKMSKHTLEVYTKEFRVLSRPGTESQSEKVTISMELEPKTAQKLEKLKGQDDWNELMKKFLKLHEQNLEQQKPIPIETKSRYIPAKIKKHVLAKTNHMCAFPDCDKPIAILHHTDRFALSKTHDPDQIVGLCQGHEKLAHLGLIENEEGRPETWKIRGTADASAPKYQIDQVVAKYRTRTQARARAP